MSWFWLVQSYTEHVPGTGSTPLASSTRWIAKDWSLPCPGPLGSPSQERFFVLLVQFSRDLQRNQNCDVKHTNSKNTRLWSFFKELKVSLYREIFGFLRHFTQYFICYICYVIMFYIFLNKSWLQPVFIVVYICQDGIVWFVDKRQFT